MGHIITCSIQKSETKLRRRLPDTDTARFTQFQVRQFFKKGEKTEIKNIIEMRSEFDLVGIKA